MQNKLADVSANIADELANAMHNGAAFFMEGKVRVHPSYDPKYEGNLKYSLQARDKTYQVKENMRGLEHLRGPWGWFKGAPAGSSASGQVASKLLNSAGLSRYGYPLGLDPYASDYTYSSYLSFYGLGTKLLALGTAMGVFGLMQDIKDMQKTKQELTARRDLDQKILDLLKTII